MIELLKRSIPQSLLRESGRVFYSGRTAFSRPRSLYVLGLNPGGDPILQSDETVEAHTRAVMDEYGADWSAYRDESWNGAIPGSYRMQPRVLHLLSRLGLNPGEVPSSNLIFIRTRRQVDLKGETRALADLCWPFHAEVLKLLTPHVVLCFGQTAGAFARERLGARAKRSEFLEKNQRRWRSTVWQGPAGIRVIEATHPSIADWTTPATDPTPLILEALR